MQSWYHNFIWNSFFVEIGISVNTTAILVGETCDYQRNLSSCFAPRLAALSNHQWHIRRRTLISVDQILTLINDVMQTHTSSYNLPSGCRTVVFVGSLNFLPYKAPSWAPYGHGVTPLSTLLTLNNSRCILNPFVKCAFIAKAVKHSFLV